MLSLRISSLVKRKEAWRRAFNWLSHQDCSMAGSLCPPALRPNMFASYGVGSHVSQRAHLHQLASPVLKAAAYANELSTLSDEATPGLKRAVQKDTLVRREAAGRFIKEDDLRRIVNDLILGSRHKDKNRIEIAIAELQAFKGEMHYPTLHSVMAEFRMQPGSSQMAEDFMNLMARKGVVMEERSYICFLSRLCKDDKILRAFEVLTDLGKAADEDATGVMPKPNTQLVNFVLAAAFRLNNKSVFYKTLDFMKRSKLQAQSSTYLEIMKMAGFSRRLPELREAWAAAVESLSPPLPISLHTARVVNLSRGGSFTEALVALEEMKVAMGSHGWDPEGQQPEEMGRGVWLNSQRSSLGGGEPGGQQGSPGGTDQQGCQVAERRWDTFSKLSLVYKSLLGAAASEGNTDAFLTLYEEMKEMGIRAFPDEEYWNMLMCSMVNSGMLSDAKKVAALMLTRGINIQPETYNVWMKACCKIGNLGAAEGLLVEALSKKATDSTMFRTLVHACILEDDSRRGERVAMMMRKARLHPSQSQYAALFGLVGLARQESPLRVARGSMQALLEEKKRENIVNSCASFHAAMWTLGSLGLTAEVMKQLRWARGLRPHFHTPLTTFLVYNTAIHACLRLGNMGAFSELMEMLEKDYLKLGMTAHRALIKEESYGNSDLQSAMTIINALPSIGREPRLATFNFLIQVVCHDNNFYAGESLLRLMVDQGVARDRNTYLHLLDCAARSGDLTPMRKLVAQMHRDGFAADMDTCLAIVTAHLRVQRHQNAILLLKTIVDQIRKTPGAPENRSEAFFEQLEKWILKDKERHLAKALKGKYNNVNTGPILEVQKEEELSTTLKAEKTEKIDQGFDVERDEERTNPTLDMEKSEKKESIRTIVGVDESEKKDRVLDVEKEEERSRILDVERTEKELLVDVGREEETSQILEVEKIEQEDPIVDVEKAKQINPIVYVKKEEDPRRRAHFLTWMRRKNA